MSKQAVLIVNTKSRQGRDRFAQARSGLTARGIEITEALAVRDPKDLPGRVQKAVLSGTETVVVGGGDGTLSSVVQYFVGAQSVLGVLPLGTGNAFARDLSIASDVEVACDVIARGQVTPIDLGIANKQYFVNVATVGLTTLIAQELNNEAKKRWGKFVYLFAITRALMRIRPFQVTLETAEETRTFETLQIVIGNGRFHAGPFPLAPDATITDGKLVVYALGNASKWTLLRYALNLPGGHHVDLPDVDAIMTTRGAVVTRPLERVTVDGEISLRTPLHFGISPRALRVMTPAGFGREPSAP
jgi:diacylglycerol kinase (ATP)